MKNPWWMPDVGMALRVFALSGSCLVIATLACGGDAGPVGVGTGDGGGVPLDPGPASAICEPLEGEVRTFPELPQRAGPAGETTGSVPHQQLNPDTTPEVIDELFVRVFADASLENRPSTLGMQGTRALWLSETVQITRSECVPGGREFAHIHVDGSLHAVLPFGLIPQAVSAGWAEPHPFATTEPGFRAFAMLFAPRSSEEVDVILQFILDSMDFITGT